MYKKGGLRGTSVNALTSLSYQNKIIYKKYYYRELIPWIIKVLLSWKLWLYW
jgi:hypothetical protein